MSGGHYDYKYFKVEELAEDIEREFLNDGKYVDDDYENSSDFLSYSKKQKEFDRLDDATAEQRIEILSEIKQLIIDLQNCSFRAKILEYYMSGDCGAESYLKQLKEKQ